MINYRVVWLLVVVTGLASFSADARTIVGDPDTQWRTYLAVDAGRDPALGLPFAHCFKRSAAAHGVPVTLLMAVARGESNFDPRAKSSANAHGLMQILWPTTAKHLGFARLDELYDPCRNVDAGTRYLKELLKRYDGDLHLALAAYNYGPQRISVEGGAIPSGATWYSGYIFRHLQYVLGDGLPANLPEDWRGEGEIELAIFAAPYRAKAFVEALQVTAPSLRLDWFRQDVARHRVVFLYADRAEYDRGRRLLAAAGFTVS
jgi:hypothetical protein